MSEITDNVEKFYKSIHLIKDHRYRSWEHCYNFFKKVRHEELDEEKLDLAQLHLSFYLASWGMYRGSSFILQKDYTIFKEIVREIFNEKYSLLWDVENNINQKDQLIDLFSELYDSLEKILVKIRTSVRTHPDFDGIEKRYLNGRGTISPTLTTKILLGTLGCIPAYDIFLMEGLGERNIQKSFNQKKSFSQMIDFYLDNKEEIDNLSKEFGGYPLMKILDMYFWVIGYKKLEQNNLIEDIGE